MPEPAAEPETQHRRRRGTIGTRPERRGYWIRWIDRYGRRRHAYGGATEQEADDELQRRLALEDDPHAPRDLSLAEFAADEFLPLAGARMTPRAFINIKGRVNRAAEHFHTASMRSLTRPDAEEFLAGLAREGVSPATLAGYRSALSVAWTAAIDRRAADENIWRGIKLQTPQERAVPFLDERDLTRIYRAMPERYRDMVVLLGETGLRRGEALDLSWRDVAPDGRTIVVRRSKTKRVRHVPLTALARETLLARRRARESVPLLGDVRVFEEVGETWTKKARATWIKATTKIGLSHVRLHDLRHARASLLVRAGVPVTTVARWLGHATARLVLGRYGHHAPDDELERALRSLESARAATPRARPRARATAAPHERPAARPARRVAAPRVG